jgi:integrase/recombinase XerC
VRRRAACLRAASHYIGTSLLKADRDDVAWLITRGQHRGLCDATVYVYAGHLRAFYNWAMDNGRAKRNPVNGAPVPKRPRYLPRPIAEDPLIRALETADARTRLVLALAAMAGLRAVEIARLRREDLLEHLTPMEMLVQGKGDKPRTVPISPALWGELQRYGLPRRGPVIRRADGHHGHLSPSAISMMANDHLHAHGLPDTLHALRHYAGTTLYRDTRDIRLVQDVLGHASPATTAIYTLWAQEDAAAALDRLGARFGRKRKKRPVAPQPRGGSVGDGSR